MTDSVQRPFVCFCTEVLFGNLWTCPCCFLLWWCTVKTVQLAYISVIVPRLKITGFPLLLSLCLGIYLLLNDVIHQENVAWKLHFNLIKMYLNLHKTGIFFLSVCILEVVFLKQNLSHIWLTGQYFWKWVKKNIHSAWYYLALVLLTYLMFWL